MDDPGQHKLWSIPGNGVLARQGDLVLLTSIDDREFAESLLELIARTSQAGGDGRALGDAVSALIEAHQSWGGPDGGPDVAAFGPAGNGLAFTVSGAVSVEFSTSHLADQRLTVGHPSMLLRSTVGVGVQSVRVTLDRHGSGDRTDRFSRLDSGTVRAGGLSYYSGQPDAAPARPAPPVQPDPPAKPTPPAQPTPPAKPAPPARPVPPAQPTPPAQPVPPAKPTPPAQSAPPARQERSEQPEQPEQDTLPPAAKPVRAESTPSVPTRPTAFDPARYGASESPYASQPGVVITGPSSVPGASASHPGAPASHMALANTTVDPAVPPAPPPVRDPATAGPPTTGPSTTGPSTGPATAVTGGSDGLPVVLGVYCKNGHFTDPDARSCLACGAGIKKRGAAPQPGPRPPLGVLVLDSGETLSVDGDYIIGRDPARDQAVTAGEARPLRVTDDKSMISRIHARVHLDGWRVLLTDLGSANGTHVQPQGAKMAQPLEPQVPVPIQPGTRFFVGSACLRYEHAPSQG